MDDYVNAHRDRYNGVYYSDTAESVPEDYDDFVGIATVSPTWYKMALNLPTYYWKQPIHQTNIKDEYGDYRRSIKIKPQTTPILPPPPVRGKCSTTLTISILAILIIAVVVSIPLGFIYIFKQETPSTIGTVKVDLTLSNRFLSDMADTSSSVFKSTELELCIEIEKALKSNQDSPEDMFIRCRLESLRNGSITASLVLTISGVYTIPDNNVYIMAITVYIGSVGTLGRYTVVPGSIVVTSATYTTAGTTITVTSRPTTPSVTSPHCPPDLASELILEGNTTVEEGERYSINCSGRLAIEEGSLDLFIKSRNSSDFVKSNVIPTTIIDDVDDFCYSSVTKTYYLLAESDLNGTEFRCVATNDKLSSYQNTSSIDVLVHFADFRTSFHLETATWIPAYADPESLEFKTFAMKVEYETNYIYSHSVLKNNYKKSKVTSLRYGSVIAKLAMHIEPEVTIDDGSGNKITTKVTSTDVEEAMRDTLPKVSVDLSVLKDASRITTDNGVNNEFSCVAKTDVVFLLDASSSIRDENFILMKYFVQNFTAGVLLGPEYIQIGLVKYSTNPSNEFWLNEYHGVTGNHSIAKAINNTEYTGGQTYIAKGLAFVRSYSLNAMNGARENASKVIILMTDGIATDEPAQIADILKTEGVLIACVAIGNGIRYDQLQSIAYNDTYIFNASDFRVLAGIAATVKQSSCEINDNI